MKRKLEFLLGLVFSLVGVGALLGGSVAVARGNSEAWIFILIGVVVLVVGVGAVFGRLQSPLFAAVTFAAFAAVGLDAAVRGDGVDAVLGGLSALLLFSLAVATFVSWLPVRKR